MYKKKASARRHSRRNAVSPAQRITAAIIEKLEAGTKPWVQPWRGIRPSDEDRSRLDPWCEQAVDQVLSYGGLCHHVGERPSAPCLSQGFGRGP